MIFFFSSGESIEVSPVEPMISTAEVPWLSWNFNKVRKAAKSTVPSLLNGVISATNEPVSSFCDILVSKWRICVDGITADRMKDSATFAVHSLPLKRGGSGWGSAGSASAEDDPHPTRFARRPRLFKGRYQAA